MPFPRAVWVRSGVTAVAYFLCLCAGLTLSRFDGGVAVIWPAGALLFARLLAMRRHHWPLVMACALPAGVVAIALFGFGPRCSLPLAFVGVGEAAGAAWLVKHAFPRFGRFQSMPEFLWFLGLGGVVVPMVGAVLAGWIIASLTGVAFWRAAADWYASHALGLLAFAPPLLLAQHGEAQRWRRAASRRQKRQAVLLLGAVALASSATFGQTTLPLVLLPMIPMVAATLRLGRFGAMASVMILMTIGFAGSLMGSGPTQFLHVREGLRFELLQGYFALVMLVLMPLAADLAARQRLLERVTNADALHRLMIERSSDVIMRLNREGIVRFVSPTVERLSGYRPEEVLGRSIFAFIHHHDAVHVRGAREALMATPGDTTNVVEYRLLHKDGHTLWVESNIRAIVDHAGRANGTVTIIRDVTRRRQIVDDLARQALTDPLTGLSNRRVFDVELGQCLANGREGCLALFDLDHFKRINDQYGHAIGDRVLQRFAEVLRESVRSGDLVVRLGGEEFAVLLLGASVESARQICERILRSFAEKAQNVDDGEPLRATVSAGLARLGAEASGSDVVAAADAALYNAKHNGRNCLAIAA